MRLNWREKRPPLTIQRLPAGSISAYPKQPAILSPRNLGQQGIEMCGLGVWGNTERMGMLQLQGKLPASRARWSGLNRKLLAPDRLLNPFLAVLLHRQGRLFSRSPRRSFPRMRSKIAEAEPLQSCPAWIGKPPPAVYNSFSVSVPNGFSPLAVRREGRGRNSGWSSEKIPLREAGC